MADVKVTLLLAAIICALIGGGWLRHMKRRHGGGALVWRWFSGMPMDGRYRTDATWLRKSSVALHPLGSADATRVGRWHHMPRLRRAGIRTGTTFGVFALVIALAKFRVATLEALAAVGLMCALFLGWRVYAGVRDWRHNRDWVKPLNQALPPNVTVKELPRDRVRTVLALDAGTVADDKFKQLIMLTAATKLALPPGDLKGDWSKLHGKKPEAVITLVPPPPGYVSFGDIRELADAAAEHEIVFGLGRKNVPGVISVDNDSPHIGLSMGSGDGKSVTARNAAAQLAHHGSLIVVLDTKFVSQHWAAGLPNVAYARTPEEVHELAIWLAGEVDSRKKLSLLHADVEGIVHANPGSRIVGILEELNTTQSELAIYWKSIGGKGRSPAVVALDKVSFIGRQVLVNLIYIGQRLSAKATSGGSGDARENLGVLLMSNPAASTWKMLVGDRHALPAATEQRGRLQVVTAKGVTEIQGAYLTGAQAREYASSGKVAEAPEGMPCVGGLAPVGTPERVAQDVQDMTAIEGNGPDLHIVPDIPRLPALPPRITIAEAVAEGISGPSVEAVRKALQRDSAAPEPAGRRGNADEFDRVAWCDWEEARRQPRRRLTR